MDKILEDIRKDMAVYDQSRHEIGVVDFVRFGDEDPDSPGPETAGPNPIDENKRGSFIENLLDVFGPDDLPEVLRARLVRSGFVRIDGEGLFSADRYIMPDQIQSVAGGKVTLKVDKSDLMKRS
ncbi:hypothetical protein [Devosia sp. A449]